MRWLGRQYDRCQERPLCARPHRLPVGVRLTGHGRSDYAGDLLDGGGPPPGPVTIEVVSASAAVVTLGGEHDVASRDAIAEAFGVAATGRDLLVDLSDCSFIDSTIIKLLLRTMRSLEDRDGRLELVIDAQATGTSRAWPS